MAFTRVHHVGILVEALEVGRHVFCDGWGLAVNEHRSPWPTGRPGTIDGTTSIEIPIGEMHIEISAPTGDGGAAAEFVAERRAGMYWVALASSDLDGDLLYSKALRDEGTVGTGGGGAGRWDLLGGTGKYAGITGSCPYETQYLPGDWVVTTGECTWSKSG